MDTRALRPSRSNDTIECRQGDGPTQLPVGYAVLQSFDSPSGAPSFTRGSLLADLEAQLAASSVSSAPLIPVAQDREYPAAIPVDLNWRDHPRWKPLITTPCRTPTLNDPLIPDRSPTPSAWSNCSDTEGVEDDSPGSFIHRRRRKEYVHRAPVWAVNGGAEDVPEGDDPLSNGQKTHPIHRSTTLPNLDPLDEHPSCVAVPKQPMSDYHTSSLPNIFEQTLEAQSMFASTPNWPLSKENLEALPASAGSIALRPRRLSKNADISILDLNKVSPPNSEIPPKDSRGSSSRESTEACWSSNRNSHESHSSRMDGSDSAEPRSTWVEGPTPTPIPEGWDDVHLISGTKINPGSVVICLRAYSPTRGDEFDMGFGDIFTVLKVFDDGWALCAESSGLGGAGGDLDQTDLPRHAMGLKSLDSGTGTRAAVLGPSRGESSLAKNSVVYHHDTITITMEYTFSTALSAKVKFLPLLAVTLLCNFGSVVRNGTCRFGTTPITASTLWLDRGSPSRGVTLAIGNIKIPDRTISLQFHTKQAICNSVDRYPKPSRKVDAGTKSIRRTGLNIQSEPLVTRKELTPTGPSGDVPARSRSNVELHSTKSVRATLKRSFGTLRRRFIQAVDTRPDTKPNPLRAGESMGKPASGPANKLMGKALTEAMGKTTGDRPTSAQSEVSLDRLADVKKEQLARRIDAQMTLEKKKRQETMARVLPTTDPKQLAKSPEGGRLIPRISFSGFSLPGF
ncbi:MAG: hypothetical protein M1840_005596 [Geoglossum simile]|nr:MAG: hypothetical protein M1840_005596 [Geoglossum simile]